MIADMAGKPRLDALEESKIDNKGDSLAVKTGKEMAERLIGEAHDALPDGVVDASPYKKLNRDELIAEGARLDMRLGALMNEADLRLVLEVMRLKMTRGEIRDPDPLPPPAPAHTPRPKKVRGLKPSTSNSWYVTGQTDKSAPISVGGGQMAKFRNGAIVEMRHYSPMILQAMVDQGLKLVPIEDGEPDED